MSSSALRRVVRRETHSPRTVAMIILSLAGQPALLLCPAAAFGWAVGLPAEVPAGVTIATGVDIALFGNVCLVLAVAPGRLAKHELQGGERRAVVADDGVIAAAIAQRVSDELFVARDRVRVGVGHRLVDVAVSPEDGIEIENERVRAMIDAELESYRLHPKPRVTVYVKQRHGAAS